MRGAQVNCASVSDHERLRAFASSYERLRAYSSAPSRVWSRLVAFSRANFFFVFGHVRTPSGTFGRVLSSFFVILRHSSSQIIFFRVWRATDGCGSGWAGRAAGCCAWLPRRGQDVHHVMIFVSNWFATAAGPRLRWFIRLKNNCTTESGSLQFLEFTGGIPDCCASSKAKRLKQLKPGSTEQSRAERLQRLRVPFGLLIPLSSSTPFHPHKSLGCTGARESRVSAEQLGCALPARAPRFTASQSLFVLKTHKTHSLTFVETLLKFQYPRRARVNPRMGAEFRLLPGF